MISIRTTPTPAERRPHRLSATRCLARGALIGAAVAVASCTLVFDAPEVQCEADGDCAALGLEGTCRAGACVGAGGGAGGGGGSAQGGGGASGWACIGDVSWPAPDAGVPVLLHQRFVKFGDEAPLAGVHAKACAPLDAACAEPLAEADSDADGRLALQVYKGFQGFVLLDTPPASLPTLMPALLPVVPPVYEDTLEGEPVHLVSQEQFAAAVTIGGSGELTADPAAGHVFGLAVDCDGVPVAGVSIQSDTLLATSQVYYMNPTGVPSATLTSTTTRGEAGYINLPPGPVTITSTSDEVGKFSSVAVVVRAGFITYVALAPSPL